MSVETPRNLGGDWPVLPLALRPQGRTCLVVGAGRTGARKVIALFEAGAEVVVVAPTIDQSLDAMLAEDRVVWRQRAFEPNDVENVFLAFAATDDPRANTAVLDACRDRGVLCGIVDIGWREGDFISPAVLRRDGLTVAVSTGGRSCRRARMVKTCLERHVDYASAADLLVLGTSHEYISIDSLERLHMTGARLETVASELLQLRGILEFVILETCNRIELHAVASDKQSTETLLRHILGFDELSEGEYYSLRGVTAFRHSSKLLAGLLSQTPGENHVVAQVKKSFDRAAQAGWSSSMATEWLASSLHVSKDIRKKVRPLLHECEVENLCLSFLETMHDEKPQNGFLVLGTGVVGRGVMDRYLSRHPTSSATWGYHRRVPEVPASWRGRARLCALSEIGGRLRESRTIVCATASANHVLDRGHAAFFDPERPTQIVDLAMPRNVAPELEHACPRVRVADLNDLKHWFRRSAADMSGIMKIANQVADQHIDMYEKLVSALKETACL